jgi:hypothetical protein
MVEVVVLSPATPCTPQRRATESEYDMTAHEIPHEWEAVARLQLEVKQSRAINPRTQSSEETLDALIEDIARGSHNDNAGARTLSLGSNRAAKYRRRLALVDDQVDPVDASAPPVDIVDLLGWAEGVKQLRTLLPPEDWAILAELAEEVSYGDVAAKLGSTEGALKVRASRIRSRIRRSAIGPRLHQAVA